MSLLSILRSHSWRWALVLLLTIAQALSYLATPLYYKLIFDRVVTRGEAQVLPVLIGGMALLLVVLFAIDLAQSMLRSALGMQSVNDLRLRMLTHVHRLPIGFFRRVRTGDVMARFTSDLAAVERVVTVSLYKVVLNALAALFCIAALFIVEWRLALFTLAVLPAAALAPRALSRRAAAASYVRREGDGVLAAAVEEQLAAHLVIRAFTLAEHHLARFRRLLEDMYGLGRRLHLLNAYVETSTNMGLLLSQALITGFGAYLVTRHALTGGSLIAFVGLLLNASTAGSTLGSFLPDLTQAEGALRRTAELLAEPVAAAGGASEATWRFGGEIRFSDVSFSYQDEAGPDEHHALEGVSFIIRAGESVALVGRSGSGKSTVVNLLMRFNEPISGAITVDGRDILTIPPHLLRDQIGAVFQSTFLFNDTIRENIRQGRLDASDAEVERAAVAARIHETILQLPHGYATVVGASNPLSGGQGQRLALARALLRNPAILILDEVTSALDPSTEAAVNETLEALDRSHTRITVTHRLASAIAMDRILVFEDGRLVEDGTHQALLDRGGAYFTMWQKQRNVFVDATGTQARLDKLFLQTVPIFSELDEKFLAALVHEFRSEVHDAGVTVIVEGKPGDTFYVIVRGRVLVERQGSAPSIAQRRSWVLEPGDCFGEMALMTDAPRSASVRTLDRCLFLTLTQEQFRNALEAAPHLRARLELVVRERRAAHL